MDNERLEVKHLAPLFPHNLLVKHKNRIWTLEAIHLDRIARLQHGFPGSSSKRMVDVSFDSFSPVMYGIQSFIEDIHVNPSRIICPAITILQTVLQKVIASTPDRPTFVNKGYNDVHQFYFLILSEKEGSEYQINFFVSKRKFGFDVRENGRLQLINQAMIFYLLRKWKIDIDNLIPRKLAIDVKELAVNPYSE